MDVLAFDIRDALRAMRRDPAYAATVILTLALTIGATTAVFSVVDGVLLKPLAYPEPQQLVSLREIWREVADRAPVLEVNERHFDYWRQHSQSFEALAQFIVSPTNLTGAGDATQVTVVRASGSLFDVLRVRAAIGRTLTPQDDGEDAPRVATLSDTLWRQRFNADPRVVGTAIVLDGQPYTIVGVLAPDFRLPFRREITADVDAVVALRLTAGWVGEHNNDAVGRLRAGVTLDQARAELDVLQAHIGDIATREAHEPVTLGARVVPLIDFVTGPSRRGLWLLLAAIGAVLLIACSNLANLSLTRAVGRLRDTAIRSALGASTQRLVGRTLIEQLALSAIGGVLGVWVAWIALTLLVHAAPTGLPRADAVTLDARVLAFAASVSMLAGLLVAVVPAWRIAGRDVQATLVATTTAIIGDRRGLRAHGALVALQVGLSVMLLIVTALFGTSFLRVMTTERGFTTEGVLAVDVSLPATRYADEGVRERTYDRLLALVRALPGVDNVSTTSLLPLHGQGQVNFIVPEGATMTTAEQPTANFRFVAPDFFRTLGLSVRRGRSFTDAERDRHRPTPALISEPTAARLWPNDDPIGKRFTRAVAGEQPFEVVGVVADARTTSLDRAQPLMVYLPYWWRSRAATSLLIKTAGDPAALLASVRRVLREIDSEIAAGDARPLAQLVDASVAARRYQAQLFVVFGAVALVIAIIGVYAVTSYGVARRRREMNIRVALGAQISSVLGLVVRQAMLPVAIGVAVGAAGALALGDVVASLLFDVQARDPLIVSSVIAVVVVTGLATCAVAARLGLSTDPAAALRQE